MRISPTARRYLTRRSEHLMEDECRIFTPGLTRVEYDPETRVATTVQGTDYYLGKCRLWEVPAGGKFDLGELTYTMSQTWLSIPYDAPVPETDQLVEMLKSVDPGLTGKILRITSVVHGGGLRGSRRMQVEFVDRKDVTK